MSEDDIHRDLGRLEAQVENLEARASNIETKLDTLLEFMATARGGWKTLLALGAIAGAAGAAIASVLPYWFGK